MELREKAYISLFECLSPAKVVSSPDIPLFIITYIPETSEPADRKNHTLTDVNKKLQFRLIFVEAKIVL
ncbi:MAG: hypothetical protein KF685_09310 [Acidobacteria bacterium]|nr:hypothetical protein [Acidobacteriota bacterium]